MIDTDLSKMKNGVGATRKSGQPATHERSPSGLRPADECRAHGDLFGLAEPEFMPVISMWQPWGSLIFLEEPAFRKGLETRGFRYPAKHHGRRIAIQAAAISPTSRIVAEKITEELDELCIRAFGARWRLTLPRGVYLGTVVLDGCSPSADLIEHIGYADRVAGIWGDGRFGWRLSDPHRLTQPIPVKGKQGWWHERADLFEAPNIAQSPIPHHEKA